MQNGEEIQNYASGLSGVYKVAFAAPSAASPKNGAPSPASTAARLGRRMPHTWSRDSTIARREIRKWLRESDEGNTVEEVVGKLLAGG